MLAKVLALNRCSQSIITVGHLALKVIMMELEVLLMRELEVLLMRELEVLLLYTLSTS